MNKTEVAQLLTVASGFDRRVVDELTVTAWHSAEEIQRANYQDALKVVTTFHTDPSSVGYFDARALVAGLRRLARSSKIDVETDVRSAKARGIIARDWPSHRPLLPEDAERLAAAREADRQQAALVQRELDSGV